MKSRIDSIQLDLARKTSFLDSLRKEGAFPTVSAKDYIKTQVPFQFGHDINLPSTELAIPDMNFASGAIPQLEAPALGLNTRLPDQILENGNLISNATELPATADVGFLNQDAVSSVIEEKLVNSEQLSSVVNTSSSTGLVTESLNIPEEISAESMKAEIRKRFLRSLTDHFKDKPAIVNEGIQKLDKLQKKYHSLADTRKIPKHRTNLERGKPFVNRLIPGSNFQFTTFSDSYTNVKVYQYVGYRFSDRFRSTVGYVYQRNINLKTFDGRRSEHPVGARGTISYKIFGDHFLYVEYEAIRSDVPASPQHNAIVNVEHRKILDQPIYLGIFKTMILNKRFDWNIMYLCKMNEIVDLRFQKSIIRFGFEYKLNVKKRSRRALNAFRSVLRSFP